MTYEKIKRVLTLVLIVKTVQMFALLELMYLKLVLKKELNTQINLLNYFLDFNKMKNFLLLATVHFWEIHNLFGIINL
jgi:hypothetical protein